MKNIHIYPSTLLHASRMLKETKTIFECTDVTEIILVGMQETGLNAVQPLDAGRRIHRISPNKGTGKLKMIRYLIWYLKVLKFCFRHRPTIINCHTLWVLPIGVILKLLTRCKLVYDAHELETEAVGESTAIRKAVARKLERLCMRAVDLLIVISPGVESWYRQQYGNAIPAITILNTPPYQELSPNRRLSAALGLPNEEKIVLYQGMLGAGRGIDDLLKAAPALKKSGYALVFMGYGDAYWMKRIMQHVGQGACYFHPAVSPDKLLEYTASADVGILWIDDNCLAYHLCLPNKLFEYFMAGLPVLMPDLPEIRNVLDKKNVGICLKNFEASTMLDALKKLDNIRSEHSFSQQINELRQEYNWQSQEQKMVDAYKKYVLV